MSTYAVGLDLGGTRIKAALVEKSEGLLEQTSLETGADKGPSHILDRLHEAVVEVSDGSDIEGLGIGSPGFISWDRSTVSTPRNLPRWDSVNVREELQERLGSNLPVIVENDANVAGLGSAFFGAGKPFDSFIMVTLGTGVGGAIIYEKEIFRGSTGGAGEIGHVSIDYEGPLDRYGVKGAIEAYIGSNFLTHHARYRLLNKTESKIHDMADVELRELTPKMLHEAARQGDLPAREVLAWAGHKLGHTLGSVINLLDIRKIVVGGGMSQAGEFILEPARQTMHEAVMVGMKEDVELVRETLGNEAGMLGAARLVFQP
jgi:glucokinase